MLEIKESKDFEIIASLNKHVQELHHSMYPTVFKPYDQNEMLKAFETMFSKPEWLGDIAFWNHTPVAYSLSLLLERNESAFMYAGKQLLLDQIAVSESHRRQGIAKALLNRVVAKAKEHGVNRVEIKHWTNNDEARKFFGNQGFQYFNECMFLDLK